MTRFALAAALLAVQLCPAAVTQAQATDDDRARLVDSMFTKYDQAPSPGLAVAVVRDGGVVLRRGYGLASLEHGVRITPATVFDVASVSKQFAGLAIAMLAEQGRLGLDDDVRTHVPELAQLGQRVTIRQLLHHTSGLRDWPGTLSVSGWRFDDVISFQQILTMAFNQRSLNFEPGAEHLYSNTGYNLLAEVVQRVTGRSFRDWTDEHLFRPLRMSATQFRDDHSEVIANRAFGYARTPQGSFRHVPNNLTALGSSSLFSSVDDLAKWMLNFDHARVGGRAAMSLMRTPGRLDDGTAVPYAFGVLTGSYRGLPMFTHSGSWAAFSTYMAYLPEQRYGVVVLANSKSIDAQDAVIRITNVFLQRELAAAVPPGPAPDSAPHIADVPPEALDAYSGLYRLGPGWYTRIARDSAGALTSRATHEEPATMAPRSEREFWIETYGASMTFHRDSGGRVTHLEYRGRRAPRIEESDPPAAPRLAEFAGEYESRELGTTYTVVLLEGGLVLQHRRHGRIPLLWLTGEEFGSPTWFLRSVAFERDGRGHVTGFVVNGDSRSRDIRFPKRTRN